MITTDFSIFVLIRTDKHSINFTPAQRKHLSCKTILHTLDSCFFFIKRMLPPDSMKLRAKNPGNNSESADIIQELNTSTMYINYFILFFHF